MNNLTTGMLLIWGWAVWSRDHKRLGREEELYAAESRSDTDYLGRRASWDHKKDWLDNVLITSPDVSGAILYVNPPEFWCCRFLTEYHFNYETVDR